MRTWVGTQSGSRQQRSSRRLRRIVGTAAVAIACSVAGPLVAPGTASAAPVDPGDAQIAAAQKTKDDAQAAVGVLTGQLASAQASADAAHEGAQIALQDYQEKQQAYEDAQASAAAAAAASDKAAADLQTGRDQVARFARDSYMQGTTEPGMTALLSSGGPAQMLERAALLDAAGQHRTDVVAQLTTLQTQARTAQRTAQDQLAQADTLKAQATAALDTAKSQEIQARTQAAALQQQTVTVQAQLVEAASKLDGLQNDRAAAKAYAAKLAAAATAKKTAAPAPAAPSAAGSSSTTSSASSSSASSSPSKSTPSSGSSSSGGSSSGGSSSGGSSAGSAPSGGTTSNAPATSVVQRAIAAARTQLGTPYAWGGGALNGPSEGIDPDAGVIGFDCSSLVRYAYHQAGLNLPRTSRDQFARYAGEQVDRGDLQPGDLLFYASGSSYATIYHVTMYIGGGKVIQAPQSGDVVKISNVWFGSDYFGAVRPTA